MVISLNVSRCLLPEQCSSLLLLAWGQWRWNELMSKWDPCILQVTRDRDGQVGVVDYAYEDDMKNAIRKLDDTEFERDCFIRVTEDEGEEGRNGGYRSRSRSPRKRARTPSRSPSRSPARSRSKSPPGRSRRSVPDYSFFISTPFAELVSGFNGQHNVAHDRNNYQWNLLHSPNRILSSRRRNSLSFLQLIEWTTVRDKSSQALKRHVSRRCHIAIYRSMSECCESFVSQFYSIEAWLLRTNLKACFLLAGGLCWGSPECSYLVWPHLRCTSPD